MTIQNIMQLAAQNGMVQFNVLDKVATNVSNINTNGYKAQRFELFLQPFGGIQGQEITDTSAGPAFITRRELDVALETPGYIPVTQPDGTMAYTRDGSMVVGKDGYLYTQRGDLIGSGIQVPAKYYSRILIHRDGRVELEKKPGEKKETIGQIPVVNFPNASALKTVGGNKLVETDASGPPEVNAEPRFAQGKLERSNVAINFEIDKILRLNAGLISNFRVIKYSDEVFRNAVNLRQ